MGVMNRDLRIELDGMPLELRFESENMMELSAITGRNSVAYVRDMIPKDGESVEDAGLRCSDLAVIVPLIMAGLCHHDEYGNLSHKLLRRRICRLIDREAMRRQQATVVVQAELAGKLVNVASSTLLAPGETVDSLIAKAEKKESEQGGPKGPPSEAPASTP